MNTRLLDRRKTLRHQQAQPNAGPAKCASVDAALAAPAPASPPALRAEVRHGGDERLFTVGLKRAALGVGFLAAAVVAWLVSYGGDHAAEPQLAVLLRGMAAIKGLLTVAAAGLVWWRLGQPASSRVASGYIACVCALVAGSVLIWQLAFILAAAALFHAGLLVGLVIAMRDGIGPLNRGDRAAHEVQALPGRVRGTAVCQRSRAG